MASLPPGSEKEKRNCCTAGGADFDRIRLLMMSVANETRLLFLVTSVTTGVAGLLGIFSIEINNSKRISSD